MKKRKPIVMRKKRKLPPHQYCLRLVVPYEPKIEKNLPHLIFHEGQWRLFRSKWKSKFRTFPLVAAHVARPTIPELKQALPNVYDAWSFGYQRPEK